MGLTCSFRFDQRLEPELGRRFPSSIDGGLDDTVVKDVLELHVVSQWLNRRLSRLRSLVLHLSEHLSDFSIMFVD